MVGGPSEVYASSRAAFFCAGMNPPCGRACESELSLRSFAQPFPSGYRGCANRPFNSLYDPFGSPCRGQKPSLPLKKAPPLTPPSLLRSEGENRPTRCSNRYAIRLADHQRSRQVMRDGTARGGMAICESSTSGR